MERSLGKSFSSAKLFIEPSLTVVEKKIPKNHRALKATDMSCHIKLTRVNVG